MRHVLIVDDEVMNREVILKVLNKEGFAVDEAENGEEALECLKNREYDLILMDLMMPVMDGFEAIHIIRTTLHSTTPIIAVSALSDEDIISRTVEIGADGYVTKPYDLMKILTTIKETLA
jgi:CheY-like chemotaxis protein